MIVLNTDGEHLPLTFDLWITLNKVAATVCLGDRLYHWALVQLDLFPLSCCL